VVDRATGQGSREADRQVASVCPYCGVGCQITYNVRGDEIAFVQGRGGPSNENRLCVKGRFGFDYVRHPHRLTKPLVRLQGAPKGENAWVDPANPWTHFREASWDEALELAGQGLTTIRDRDGGRALAGFGSAKCSNEEAFLFQKLVRTGFGSNNVDHCTRLCHASSVAALMEGIGSGAVTAPFNEAMNADVIVVIGANPTENHPVAATYFKQAPRTAPSSIVMDPRGQALRKHATHMLQFRPGGDVAMLNGIMHVIVEEGLYDTSTSRRTPKASSGSRAPRRLPARGDGRGLRHPGRDAPHVARTFARAERAIVFWGMGVSQHVHGTDNARCLISLVMMCGHVGRPGTGLHPLRGQNNVQGASDAGLIPMVFPDYNSVTDPPTAAAGGPLGDQARPGARPHRGRDHGRDPRRADPRHVRHGREPGHVGPGRAPRPRGPGEAGAPRRPGHLPDRDGDARRRGPARLRLAGEGRHGHQHEPHRADGPPRPAAPGRGAAGLVDHPGDRAPHGPGLGLRGPADVFAEMKRAMPSLDNITWERLEREDAVTYPCPAPDHPGLAVVFSDGDYPTADGRAKLVPAAIVQPAERPDEAFPFILTTGRTLEHWHTGSMTRRAGNLDALEPEAFVSVNSLDMRRHGLRAGDYVDVATRRGAVR
jgi:formate dehydrogenase major subunit